MSKNKKPFQNINSALATVWGTPTTGGRGVSVKKAANARRAGVTIDHPLTEMAQCLAAEIRADEVAKETAEDPRSPFEKQYDIRDNIAHVTPDQFREVFLSQSFHRIKNRSHTIRIDDGQGLSADFILTVPDTVDKNLKIVSSRNIAQLGLSGLISKGNEMLVHLAGRDIGILKILSIPAGLMCHSQIISASTKPSMKNDTALMIGPETIAYNSGNAHEVLTSTCNLKSSLRLHFENGVELTASAFRKGKDGALKVGTLWHPERVNKEDYLAKGYLIKPHNYRSFINKIFRDEARGKCYSDEKNPAQFISEFFNGAAGYALTYKGQTVAIVLRADVPDPAKKTLG